MEQRERRATVALLMDKEGRICLARKKKAIHRDGEEISYSLGMWNGYGGKMQEGDRDILSTAIRELKEEAGIKAEEKNFEFVSRIYFFDSQSEELFMDVCFFLVKGWKGKPKETKEMGPPSFFKETEIPYHEMMPADKVIFQKALEDKKYFAKIIFSGKNNPPEFIELEDELV
ncbi:MAG: hydrolase [Candidatus Nomurabacteria bacterium]|nr:hydrolase [Candidatus Nomurabacteria bacterium]